MAYAGMDYTGLHLPPPNIIFYWEGFQASSVDLGRNGWKMEVYSDYRSFAQIIALCSPGGEAIGKGVIERHIMDEIRSYYRPDKYRGLPALRINLSLGKDIVERSHLQPKYSFVEVDPISPVREDYYYSYRAMIFQPKIKAGVVEPDTPKLIIPDNVEISEVLDVINGRFKNTNKKYFEDQLQEAKPAATLLYLNRAA